MESLYCRYCGARLDRNSRDCPQCGRHDDHPAHHPDAHHPDAQRPESIDPHMEAFRWRIHAATPRIWMTYVLMGLVCVGYVWQIFVTRSLLSFDVPGLIAAGANDGSRTLNGEWWRLLSCVFLHGSLIHFAMNMYCFYSLGPLVERLLGNWSMGVLFIVSGLCGSIASVNWNPNAVSIGASGAVFGVAGALLGYLLHQRRNIPSALFSELANGATTFVVLNIVLAASIKHVDQAAHIGGLVGGFIVGLIQASDSSPTAVAWRPLRNALAALVGVIAVATVTQFHRAPPRPMPNAVRISVKDEFLANRQQATEIEKVARSITSDVNPDADSESNSIRMERDVLKPWQNVRGKLEIIRGVSSELHSDLAGLADYYAKREASWRLFVEYLKTHDEKKLAQFDVANEAVNRESAEIFGPPDDEPSEDAPKEP